MVNHVYNFLREQAESILFTLIKLNQSYNREVNDFTQFTLI